MDAQQLIQFRRQLRFHVQVFLALVVLTAITVGVAYMPLSRTGQIVAQAILAVLKGALILAFFMHLISEKRSTLLILASTAVLVTVLMVLTVYAFHNHPVLTRSTASAPAVPAHGSPARHVP